MTEEKKHDENDLEKLSDEDLENVDGGYAGAGMGSHYPVVRKGKKKPPDGIGVGKDLPDADLG